MLPFPTLRINCGGALAYTDSQGRVWAPDQSFTSGAPFDAGLLVADAPLYATERFFNIFEHTAPFQYEIPVPNGDYGIVLHFAEVFFQVPQSRVFDVWVEGILVRDSLDLFVEAGFATPLEIFSAATVSDGFLTIELGAEFENPKISGIEVFDIVNFDPPTAVPTISPAPTLAPTTAAPSISRAPTPAEDIYINCGGGGYLNNAGDAFWQADTYFQGGGVFIDGSNPITPTLDDTVFISERNGQFSYEIPVPVATYDVTVHMAEL